MNIKCGMIAAVLTGLVSMTYAAPSTLVQSVTRNSETITMRLTQIPLRGANFELWSQNSSGAYDVITPVAERSYIGTVDEYPGAVSCGVLKDDGTTFWGAIYFDRGATWFTLGSSVTGTRGLSAPGTYGVPDYTVEPGHIGSTTYGFDLGMDANYEYYTERAGRSIPRTFEMIEYSVALTRALYIRDAQLRPYLGRVIVRTSQAHDPEQGHTTDGAYLAAMTTEWNTDHADSNFDLVAGIAKGLHQYGGLASSGYSVNGSDANGNFSVVWRHEMGHNWGLGHYDGGAPEGSTINSGNNYARMSGPEVERVLNRRDSRMGIIDEEGIFSDVDLPPYASIDRAEFRHGVHTQLVIDVLANDHDANGDTFTISSFDTTSAKGGIVAQQGQLLTYTPAASFSGADYFLYTIEDSSGQTAVGVATVLVYVDDALRLYLPLDEVDGSEASDASLFRHTGEVSGTDFTSSSVAGRFGNAIDLDGVNDHVEVPSVLLNTNTVTLSGWIKQGASQTANAGIIFERSSGGSGLNIGSANELRYHWNGSKWGWNSGLVPPADTWTFVALVIEPTRATIYMNSGAGFQTAINTGAHAPANFGTILIGGDPNWADRHFGGTIDDVRIYNYSMTQAELQELYDGGIAASPTPFDGETDVVQRKLSWVPAGGAQEYDVYLGTNQAAVASATKASPEYQESLAGHTIAATDLADNTMYYWRVDTVHSLSTNTGAVWSFTTGILPPPGTIIAINFDRGGGETFSGGELIGPLATDSLYWNAATGSGGSLNNLINNIGAPAAVDIQWQSANTWGNSDGTADDEHRMASGYLDDGNSGSGKGATVTINNIPYAAYRIYGLFATDQSPCGIINFSVNGTWSLGGSASTTTASWGTISDNHTANGTYWTEINPGVTQGNYWTVESSGSTCTIVGEPRSGSNRGCLTAVIIEALPDTDGDGDPDVTDPDDDGDGMTDVWEIDHALDPLLDDRGGNPDHDAYNNWAEYVTDTSPQDGNSWQTFSVERAAGTGDPSLRFSTSANRNYAVEYRDDMTSGSWMDLNPVFSGTGVEMTVFDPDGGPQRYYRLRIEQP